jgi:hypothetical protein
LSALTLPSPSCSKDLVSRFHSRSHLLDGRALRIARAVRQRPVALRLLAALAGVGLAADGVHRAGQRRARLVADGTERHGPGGETLDDLHRRLDLIDGDGLIRPFQLHQAAEGQQALVLLVDELGVLREGGCRVGAGRVLELRDAVRRPDVILAAQPIGVVAADV